MSSQIAGRRYCPVAVTVHSTARVIPPPDGKIGIATPCGGVVFCNCPMVNPPGQVAPPDAVQTGLVTQDSPGATGSKTRVLSAADGPRFEIVIV